MEIMLLPILLPLGLLSLWFKNGRKKSFSALWQENDLNVIQAEGMAFILGSFALVMGIALLAFALIAIVVLLVRVFNK